MPQWEYLALEVDGDRIWSINGVNSSNNKRKAVLKRLQSDGWQMAYADRRLAYMKRPNPTSSAQSSSPTVQSPTTLVVRLEFSTSCAGPY
jgi:hypothetical protein